MGNILNRYYDIPETHGHDDNDRDMRDKEEYGSGTIEEGDYEEFFSSSNEKNLELNHQTN